MTNAIAKIEPLQTALALATEAGDLAAVRDVAALAAALQKGAKARGMGIEAENQAAEVVLRAERAMGRMLPALLVTNAERASARPTVGSQRMETRQRNESPEVTGSYLRDLGITRKESSLWQRLARVWDDQQFEEHLAYTKQLGARIAKVDFYKGPKAEVRRDAAVIRDVSDKPTTKFAAFKRAAEDMLPEMTGLPNDELRDVGLLIRELAQEYNAVRTFRTQ